MSYGEPFQNPWNQTSSMLKLNGHGQVDEKQSQMPDGKFARPWCISRSKDDSREFNGHGAMNEINFLISDFNKNVNEKVCIESR